METLKEKIGHNPQYRIDCASSDNTPACHSVYCDNPKSVKRVAGQLRRYYTSVAIKGNKSLETPIFNNFI